MLIISAVCFVMLSAFISSPDTAMPLTPVAITS